MSDILNYENIKNNYKPVDLDIKAIVINESTELAGKLRSYGKIGKGWISYQSRTEVLDETSEIKLDTPILWGEFIFNDKTRVNIRRTDGNWLLTEIKIKSGNSYLLREIKRMTILGDKIYTIHEVYYRHSVEFGWRPWISAFKGMEGE